MFLYLYMTHVVKIDILTGYKEKGNLHFILKIIFHCIFIGITMHFLKTFTIYFNCRANCLTKFFKIFISKTLNK